MALFNKKWTDQQDSDLRRLAELGWSASAIGDYVGMSRGSVIGRANRLKPRVALHGSNLKLTDAERRERHNARNRAWAAQKRKQAAPHQRDNCRICAALGLRP